MGLDRIHVEKEGNVRQSGSGRKAIDHLDDLRRDPSRDTLIHVLSRENGPR